MILILIDILAIFGVPSFTSEHFFFGDYKAHGVNDLLLLTGIAIILRPKPIGNFRNSSLVRHNDDSEENGGADIDYSLLLGENNEEQSGGEIVFEMTTNSSNRL